MKWIKKHISLGEIKSGKKKELIFTPEGELKSIRNMVSSCGCSSPKKVGNTIVVTYTPGSVPFHLRAKGEYITTKNITIYYNDGTSDILSFTATIKS